MNEVAPYDIILANLFQNEEFADKVTSHLKQEYFEDYDCKYLFNVYQEFFTKYETIPKKQSLKVEVFEREDLAEDEYKSIISKIDELYSFKKEENLQWLVDTAEKFCQNRAISNAVMESIDIIEKNENRDSIPEILRDALAVRFDEKIAYNYFDEIKDRVKSYFKNEKKFPCDIEMLNSITDGGFDEKTLNVFAAASGVGKSLFLSSLAAHYISDGKNVIYITLELSEEQVAKRIDANLLDISLSNIDNSIPKKLFEKLKSLKTKTPGRLEIKEYPTGSAGITQFKTCLKELETVKGFVPDVIVIDYLGICASSRLRADSDSYSKGKSVSEEIRGLAQEYECPVFTATQYNRSGAKNPDVDETHLAESFGIMSTADLLLGLVTNEDLESRKQIIVKQLKNRNHDINKFRKFVIGIDRETMKIYNLTDKQVVSSKGILDKIDDEKEMPSKKEFSKKTSDKEIKTHKFEGFTV